MPAPLIEAVLWHERLADSTFDGFNPTIAVHFANVLDNESNGTAGQSGQTQLATASLERFGLAQRVGMWREHCLDA